MNGGMVGTYRPNSEAGDGKELKGFDVIAPDQMNGESSMYGKQAATDAPENDDDR